MSLTPVTSRNATDTSAAEGAPSNNYADSARLRLRTAGGQTNYAYVYFARPFPLGATITSATLRVYGVGAWGAATRNMVAKRITASWKQRSLTWNNKPAVTLTNAVTVQKTAALVDGQEWAFNVTAMLQEVSDGTAWYGFRLELDDATLRKLYSAQAAVNKPTLEVTYSNAPDAPTTLSPSGGRAVAVSHPTLRFDFTDVAGNTLLDAVQVQINATDTWGAPSFDTGTIITNTPSVDLSASSANMVPSTFGNSGTFDTDANNWTAITNNATTRQTTAPQAGAGHLRMRSTAGGDMESGTPAGTSGIPVVGNQTYTVQAYQRTAVSARTTRIDLQWYDAAGASISTTTGSGSANTTSYATRTTSGTAPTNAAFLRIRFHVAATGAANEDHYWDTVTLTQGSAVYPGLAADASTYWRVRVRDGSGLWSAWSSAALFTRTTKGTLTITNPAADPNDFVQEATPPITWTFTGRTQKAWQVILTDSTGQEWLYTSGKKNGTELSHTLPPGYINEATTYRVRVRAWDTIEREGTPTDAAYTEAERTFDSQLNVGVSTITGLTSTDLTPEPGCQLDWSRATQPDLWTIVRDGDVIASGIDGNDLFVSGTSYRYVDRGADPRKSHTWSVRAVVNGQSSANNPTTTKTLEPVGIWIVDPDRSLSVCILDDEEGSWAMEDDAENYYPLGARKPIRITQALRGYSGQVNGLIADFAGVTCDTWESRIWQLKETPGRTYQLTMSNMSIPVIIGNVVVHPLPWKEIVKQVSFDFWQVGGFPFKATL